MKKMVIGLLALMFCSAGMAQKKIFYINSQLKDCTGVGPMKCIQYREKTTDAWKPLYQAIEGFDYTPGYKYKIKVKQSRTDQPPADGSSIRYTFIKLISKEKDSTMETQAIHIPNGKYLLTELWINEKRTAISDKAYEVEFNKEKLQVNAKICNVMGGGFTTQGNQIKFGPLRSTKMMCPDMDYETAFSNALMQVDQFSYDGPKLYLKKGDRILITLIMPVK